jgi:inner membrane protein
MMAGSHVALGLAAWTAAAPHCGLPALAPASLALAACGALLPDLDHPRSWAGRRLRPVSVPLSALLGHRGFTHSALALALCAVALRLHGIGRGAALPLAIGYASHLLADAVTPAGLPLFWPLRRRFALPLCRTGSVREVLLVAGLLAWVALDTSKMTLRTVTDAGHNDGLRLLVRALPARW